MDPIGDRFDVGDWATEWVLPYAREANLRPVAVAILGHAMLVVTGGLLVAWRTGSVAAWLLLVGAGALTAGLAGLEVSRFGRPGPTWVALAATWVAGGALAWLAQRTDLL